MARCGLVCFLALLLSASLTPAQPASSAPATPLHVLLLTQSKGFEHDVVKQKDGKPCVVEVVFKELADKTKLFSVESIRDASLITPEKLKDAQIVVFYTTGDLPLNLDAFEKWLSEGGSFLGIHCATDTLHGNPKYLNIINGEFEAHPWTQDVTVTLKVNDNTHPATKTFPEHHTIKEEIYQQKDFSPAAVHLLMSLDMERTAMKRPQHIPLVWCKEYGKGKVFYTELGHREDVWTSQVYQDHLIGAIKWLGGLEKADATPNPKVSEEEEKIAKAAAAGPSTESLPKVPDGFTIKSFVRAPEFHSPSSMCVSPDGKVFVAEDEYNSGDDRAHGLSRIKLCVDTNNSGHSGRVTVFADKLNAPQGMTYVAGTLYVVHAPYLTAFRDTKNTGIADVREDLVTGLGPPPQGLVHHIPSGVRMGIDGWLYISVGDKGIQKAVGKDGSTIQLHGGGVVRVRPDGTELQVFCTGTRNMFNVAIDPYLNIFTRDNTNDGGGWNERLSQMQRDAVYGYPSLFINYPDEIIPCIEDYGGGGPTGVIYIQEPNYPGTYGDSLYTLDWGRGVMYRHETKAKGATFTLTQEEFCKPIAPTAIDVDGQGRIFLCDFARKSWGKSEPSGIVYLIQPNTAVLSSFPDMPKLTVRQLLNQFLVPSQTRRREAQREVLRRGSNDELVAGLAEIAQGPNPLFARVSAALTLIQLDAPAARPVLLGLINEPELREFALRALADRQAYLADVDPQIFASALKDVSPRVRTQAAIALGHFGNLKLAKELVPLTADEDVMARHAAMQSLRMLNAHDACFAVLNPYANPNVTAGALRTLRTMHDPKVVEHVGQFLATSTDQPLRKDALVTLTRLYQKDAEWDGSWWETRPDTRGPYFKGTNWEQTPTVANLMINAMSDHDPVIAAAALKQIGMARVQEAAGALAKLAMADGPMRIDACKALIDLRGTSPEALAAMKNIALSETFDQDLRISAAQSLGATESPAARGLLLQLLAGFDAAPKTSDALIEKSSDAVAAKPAAADEMSLLETLLHGTRKPTRFAAATSILRSDVPVAMDRVKKIWADSDADELDSLLDASAHIPTKFGKPQLEQLHVLLKDKRDPVRHAAIAAIGHLSDTTSIDDLVTMAKREKDREAATTALAHFGPDKLSDQQIAPVTKLMVENSVAMRKGNDQQAYGKVLNAAEKLAGDSRIPAEQSAAYLVQLKQSGVTSSYRHTEPIPVADAAQSFSATFTPEQNPAGPFSSFTANGKAYDFKPQSVKDPRGALTLQMPNFSVMYLTATHDSSTAGPALLTLGSDDGIKVWLNGKQIHAVDVSRALKTDLDKVPVTLNLGTNTLLFRLNNHTDGAGIQARIRSRVPEFDLDELPEVVQKFPGTAERGKLIFQNVGCVKCHTLDSKEEPKGPFLGDAGSKYDLKYLLESVTRPSAKIAQGFATVKLVAKSDTGGETEYIGFVTKESADEVQLRDPTGKVTIVATKQITRRVTLPGSMMPDGLTDPLPLDDFGSLMTFLQSLKK